jgi:acyl-CoA dehydrogenase
VFHRRAIIDPARRRDADHPGINSSRSAQAPGTIRPRSGMPYSPRRLQIGAWAIGLSQRAFEMMCTHVKQRTTFGAPLADRQAVQWWIADAATRIHACRLMVHDAAARFDKGEDIRQKEAMVKVFATEMVGEILDHAMQAFGAMGMTKELPLQLMAQKACVMRIYEGPSEVHRMTVAWGILASVK